MSVRSQVEATQHLLASRNGGERLRSEQPAREPAGVAADGPQGAAVAVAVLAVVVLALVALVCEGLVRVGLRPAAHVAAADEAEVQGAPVHVAPFERVAPHMATAVEDGMVMAHGGDARRQRMWEKTRRAVML